MLRLAWNCVVCLSLLLLVLTAGIAVRSFFVGDMLEHFRSGPANGYTMSRSRIRVITGRGAVYIAVLDEQDVATNALEQKEIASNFVFEPFWSHEKYPAAPANSVEHSFMGCGYGEWIITNPVGWSEPYAANVRFPLWIPMGLFAGPGFVWLLRRRLAARRGFAVVGVQSDRMPRILLRIRGLIFSKGGLSTN